MEIAGLEIVGLSMEDSIETEDLEVSKYNLGYSRHHQLAPTPKQLYRIFVFLLGSVSCTDDDIECSNWAYDGELKNELFEISKCVEYNVSRRTESDMKT